ncbi:MAG TPA: 5-oxoprolinase subunit PxpA [Candidatus Limnocylindria bacterium]|nr:5-oxoprolinase subunit PxpA [Candidatus Limnocylindria bacterium]
MKSIDLNSDLGEGAGTDAELMPLISSANVACGGHAGDERTMRETIALARKHGVAIGAHPGYPDRENFGRDAMEMSADDLSEEIARQIRALRRVDPDLKISHVKAHGALYNEAWRDATIAKAIVDGVKKVFPAPTDVALFAAPKSAIVDIALKAGLRVVREGFADRAYEKDGTLRSRKLAGALHTDPQVAAKQALSFVRDGGVRTHDGALLELDVDTLCLHGDTPGAPAIAAAVRRALVEAGVQVRAAVIWR